MKTIIRYTSLLLVLISATQAWAGVPELTSEQTTRSESANDSHFSIRERPVALAFGVYGGEFYYETDGGYFLGLTAFVFDETNLDKQTRLLNDEFGLKIGKFFGKDSGREYGFWIQGAVNLNHTKVSTFNASTSQTLQAEFYQISAAVEAGYQFRLTFIDPRRLNLRLGAGVGYKPSSTVGILAADGTRVPIGVRKRIDPTLEFTLGYLL